MKKTNQNQKGFSAVEVFLVLIVVAAVAGVGYWVVKQHNKTGTSTPATAVSTPVSPAASAGTASAIDQLISQDAQSEQAIDSKNDSTTQSDATSTNPALNNLGGAYNESNF